MKDKRVKPLKSRTMTLNELQLETLDLIRKVRFQFNKNPYEEGMTDDEFLDQVVWPLESQIYSDRAVLKMKEAKNKP